MEAHPGAVAPDYEELYRRVVPSVVSVYADGGGATRGAGSGFVYDDAHVVTNDHVVGDRRTVSVRFADGSWLEGQVVGVDAYTDLAVVRVDGMDAEPLAVATDAPVPGRPVAALGNPMGLDGSVTAGIVSGVNRSMAMRGGFSVPDVVQTDAAINPGNSGGPLVAATADGGYEVVGVNRAKGGDNIGFAVSARLVARVVPSLVADGVHRHPYLRVRTMDVTPALAAANGLVETDGVLVVDVGEDGPAASDDGLRGCSRTAVVGDRELPVGGDVIVAADGEPVRTHEELVRHLILHGAPGETVALSVYREDETTRRVVEVELAERPGTAGTVPVR
ncbi:S1C family serine protease [Halobaculum lipolyticum]|uniref:S1C family serine protease n=1 Tax=Halobaculum lipolyticum TaxID=3032001 RepID=A0ABD5WFM9_9EURY|nr:trypsin-like peptidase domain-containing protein [Halobaculum sp. DT31]